MSVPVGELWLFIECGKNILVVESTKFIHYTVKRFPLVIPYILKQMMQFVKVKYFETERKKEYL